MKRRTNPTWTSITVNWATTWGSITSRLYIAVEYNNSEFWCSTW